MREGELYSGEGDGDLSFRSFGKSRWKIGGQGVVRRTKRIGDALKLEPRKRTEDEFSFDNNLTLSPFFENVDWIVLRKGME